MPTKSKTKTAQKPVSAPAVKQAEKPVFVHVHAEAKLNGNRYTGLSKYINANRKARVANTGPHKYHRTAAQLTDRSKLCFYAIRDAYGEKPFQARGLDNAILAMLSSAGLIQHVAKSGDSVSDGDVSYLQSGETPLQFAITAAGAKYGKA